MELYKIYFNQLSDFNIGRISNNANSINLYFIVENSSFYAYLQEYIKTKNRVINYLHSIDVAITYYSYFGSTYARCT